MSALSSGRRPWGSSAKPRDMRAGLMKRWCPRPTCLPQATPLVLMGIDCAGGHEKQENTPVFVPDRAGRLHEMQTEAVDVGGGG